MHVLDKSQIPVVAIEAMNAIHWEEVEIIDALAAQVHACKARQVEPQTIDPAFAGLVEHMRRHFAGEEQQMQGAGFPPYLVHKAEHERVLGEAQAAYDSWVDTRDLEALGAYLRDTLPNWMVQHIETMDRVTAQFLSNRAPDEGAETSS